MNTVSLLVPEGKNVYFLSDFHLGAPNYESSLIREKKIVHFLESIRSTASAVFILGDMFDFWFEYKKVVPKGYVRLLGKLAELSDQQIPIYFFIGNHDMWMKEYLQKEIGITIFYEPQIFNIHNQLFYIGHGDGLGPGDHGYKFIKAIFKNPVCKWLFAALPPSAGIGLANYFSRKSRKKTGMNDAVFLGEEGEWLIIYCREVLARQSIQYFIFGHRHLPIFYPLNEKSIYINLGDWITHFTYAVLNQDKVILKQWTEESSSATT